MVCTTTKKKALHATRCHTKIVIDQSEATVRPRAWRWAKAANGPAAIVMRPIWNSVSRVSTLGLTPMGGIA